MGQKDVGDVGRTQAELAQGVQRMRQGGVVGGIHHGNLVVFDDEMDGGELGRMCGHRKRKCRVRNAKSTMRVSLIESEAVGARRVSECLRQPGPPQVYNFKWALLRLAAYSQFCGNNGVGGTSSLSFNGFDRIDVFDQALTECWGQHELDRSFGRT